MKQVKPKYIYPTTTGATDSTGQEGKDCVVRAFANATGKTYEESHKIFADAGRKDGHGTETVTIPNIMHQHGFKTVLLGDCQSAFHVAFNNPSIPRYEKAISLGKLLVHPVYSKGTHVFVVRGHAFTVIDGKILDKLVLKAGKRVFMIFSK